MSSGGLGGSRLSDVGVSCRTSRTRRGRCDGALTKLTAVAGAPVPAGVEAVPEGVLARPPTGALDRALQRWVSFRLTNSRSIR